jgi:AmiR/NasT family two-component response regulator
LSSRSVSSPHSADAGRPGEASHGGRDILTGKRVVICEDEGVTQMQLRRALTRAGMTIAGTASNGIEAVEVTLRERPDLVLMDVRMPAMDGIEATRRIVEAYPVCVIMLTAFSSDEHQERAQAAGASGYVIKPIISDVLLPILRQSLSDFQEARASISPDS